MPHINPEPEQFAAFMDAPIVGPVVMVNLLRFKPDGGEACYEKYAQLAAPHIMKAGVQVLFRGVGRAAVIGTESWDEILLVQYPSRQHFFDMVTTPEYQTLSEYRTAALEDSRLYCSQAR